VSEVTIWNRYPEVLAAAGAEELIDTENS